jgi:hypothetical protein
MFGLDERRHEFAGEVFGNVDGEAERLALAGGVVVERLLT